MKIKRSLQTIAQGNWLSTELAKTAPLLLLLQRSANPVSGHPQPRPQVSPHLLHTLPGKRGEVSLTPPNTSLFLFLTFRKGFFLDMYSVLAEVWFGLFFKVVLIVFGL